MQKPTEFEFFARAASDTKMSLATEPHVRPSFFARHWGFQKPVLREVHATAATGQCEHQNQASCEEIHPASCDGSVDHHADGELLKIDEASCDDSQNEIHVEQMHRAPDHSFTKPLVSPQWQRCGTPQPLVSPDWHRCGTPKTSLALEHHVRPSRLLARLAPRRWRSKNVPEFKFMTIKFLLFIPSPT